MKIIKKIRLLNFKKFKTFEVSFDDEINLLIGDNESGKSTILTALDLVMRGSRTKVETIGLDSLFNTNVIAGFLNSDRNLNKLPELRVELYLNEQNNEITNGNNNLDKKPNDGIRLVCKPNDDYSESIKDVLKKTECLFPFEYYSISFTTFNDIPYNGYNKHLKHILIDNSLTSNEYAMKEYVKDIYNSKILNTKEKFQHQHEYRNHKEEFKNKAFKAINERLDNDYKFAIKSNSKSNVESDLTIYEGDISIDNKGKGKQSIIKTSLALSKSGEDFDVVLLEEPENHLSHSNMKKLIEEVIKSTGKQIFVATHSDLISTRLDLRKSILLNSSSKNRIKLADLPEDTSKFFIKAPDNNILEFILSDKVILVEGDAEFILLEALYIKKMKKSLVENNIHVISVGGTSFPRYLDLAVLLDIKTAVITDNDKNYEENIASRYSKYSKSNIGIFADKNDNRYTFEVCIYQDNIDICEDLFSAKRRKLTVQEYMLKDKAEVAYQLLENKSSELNIPQYIDRAFEWIND
ncbi:putative ATP-dependent endonuclease of OLD family [Leeuwenhoekiella aestuarii]|uniref:Putative ATP-dependent endonuclease of OLD family n=1 Tax=Leeuwenhoekiella aestuarii TaxID=2249426 RepID=A0A4Q0NZL5_9FLAO|nr:TOPRIM nucleotidyl transferase/hydrolase domain-containing protein [Leeuwenhoekiella aestuarii]RXG18307.1 putative ATP-dependent endonuclease of OLD family [Leeuwenhoekiella aestuarii]RXG19612.1 putative ATP-dependent endonuclease of OLD family [Leeuwenhoekiella aestuarii]